MAKKNPAPAPEVEVVEKPGLGIDDGIILTTFLVLAAAIALVVMATNSAYPS
jgi:hypothetical protein